MFGRARRLMVPDGTERREQYGFEGWPGPAIGYLQECLRWWDHWLKGEDTGVMEEPALRVWMQESVPPAPVYEVRPGRWVGEPVWPPPGRALLQLGLGPGRLTAR